MTRDWSGEIQGWSEKMGDGELVEMGLLEELVCQNSKLVHIHELG
jgi:hypothetical protein